MHEVHLDKTEALATPEEAGIVTRFGLLAAEMPSLLKRLRPMDNSSVGMLGFLFRHAHIAGAPRA